MSRHSCGKEARPCRTWSTPGSSRDSANIYMPVAPGLSMLPPSLRAIRHRKRLSVSGDAGTGQSQKDVNHKLVSKRLALHTTLPVHRSPLRDGEYVLLRGHIRLCTLALA